MSANKFPIVINNFVYFLDTDKCSWKYFEKMNFLAGTSMQKKRVTI